MKSLIGYHWASTSFWVLVCWRYLQAGAEEAQCWRVNYTSVEYSDELKPVTFVSPVVLHETICISGHTENWDDAYKVCQYNSSYLLTPDSFQNLNLDAFKSIEGTNELLHIGIRRQYGIFNWVGLKPKKLRISVNQSHWGGQWQDGEPQGEDCVAVNMTNGRLVTVSCTNKLLKFVCGRIESHDMTSKICPHKWKYSHFSKLCLLESRSDASHLNAAKICRRVSGKLISNKTYFDSFPVLRYHTTKRLKVWLNMPSDGNGTCYYGERNGSIATIDDWNCNSLLGIVCEQAPFVVDIKVEMKDHTPRNGKFREINKTEIECLVYVNGVETDNSINCTWWKNYEILSRGGRSFFFNYHPQNLGSYTLQGRYWCEVIVSGYPDPVSSSPLEFYDENTFTMLMILEGSGIPYDPVKHDRSQNAFEYDFKQRIKNDSNKILNKLKQEYPHLPESNLELLNVSKNPNGTTTLKINIYFNHEGKVELKDVESDIFKPAWNALSNLCRSEMHKWNLTMYDIEKIGVCFKEISSTTLGNITWNPSYHSKHVSSAPMCLNADWTIVTRSCNGGYGERASWSSFDHRQCAYFNKVLENTNHHECQPGYSSWNYSTCIRIYSNPANWSEAVAECGLSLGFLFTPRLHTGSVSIVDDFNSTFKIFEQLGEMWLGGWRENGIIQWMAFDPGPVGLKETSIVDWEEDKGQETDCVSGIVHNGKISVLNKHCKEKKPYVCMHRNPKGKLYPSSDCGENWYGSPWLKTCYMVNAESLTWQEARHHCQSYSSGGKLAVLTSPEENDLIKNHLLSQKLSKNGTWWIGLERMKNRLLWLDSNGSETMYVDWELGAEYNSSMSAVALRKKMDVNDVRWVELNHSTKIPSVCQAVRTRGLARCHVSSREYVMPARSIKGGDIGTIYICESQHAAYGSATWYKDGVAVSGSRGLIETNSKEFDPFHLLYNSNLPLQQTYHLQGYYWCEVQQSNPFRSVPSQKVLYIDEEYWTFVCHIISRDRYFDVGIKNFWNGDLRKNLKKRIFGDDDDLVHDIYVTDISRTDEASKVVMFLYCERVYSKESELSRKRNHMEKIRKYLKDFQSTISKKHNISLDGISVMNTDVCFNDVTVVGKKALDWKATRPGRKAVPVQTCIDDDGYPVVRKCHGNFTHGVDWEPFNSTCSERKSKFTISLKKLSQKDVADNNVRNISETLEILTKNSDDLIGMDLHYVAKTLENIANQNAFADRFVDSIAGTINNVMAGRPEVIEGAQITVNASSRIIASLEKVLENSQGMRSVTKSNIGIMSLPIRSQTESINGLRVKDEHRDGFEQGDVMPVTVNSPIPYSKTLASIVIPLELITARKGKSINFIVYKNATLFITSERQKPEVIVSPVISAFFAGGPIHLSSRKIEAVFKTWQTEKEKPGTAKCVYWDQSMNDEQGGWSSAGCSSAGCNTVLPSGHICCKCDHLTSFAVLVELYENDDVNNENSPHAVALEIITYLGCTLSIFGLLLMIITFALFRKLRNGPKNQVLCNLAISLLLSLIVFMAGINQTHWKPGCMLVAALLHYLLMVSFAWMLVEAILQYLRLVKVIGTYIPRFMLKSAICAWGIPLVVVVTVLAIDYELYHSERNYCWINIKAFYYGFLFPGALIMTCNLIVFVVIIHSITCGRQKGLRTNQDERKLIITRLRAACCILFLLGLSWSFGFLAVSEAKPVFQYLFSIFTTLQGFFIFIFHVVQEKTTRNMWYRFIFYRDSQVHTLTTRDTSTYVSRNK